MSQIASIGSAVAFTYLDMMLKFDSQLTFTADKKRVMSYTSNGSGTVARTRHTDWRPTDTHTRTDSPEATEVIRINPF